MLYGVQLYYDVPRIAAAYAAEELRKQEAIWRRRSTSVTPQATLKDPRHSLEAQEDTLWPEAGTPCQVQRLDAELTKFEFALSAAGPGFSETAEDGIFSGKGGKAYHMVYVDDILIASNSKKLIKMIKQQLTGSFDARDMGEAKAYLGMNIERDREAKTIRLSQSLTQVRTRVGHATWWRTSPLGSTKWLTARPRAFP